MSIKIPREKKNFVTDEGLLTFLYVMPGQAQPSQQPGSFAYKCEWNGIVTPGHQVELAITEVAKAMDPANWMRHVRGPEGRIRFLEEMPKRDKSKYPYAQGKHILSFSSVQSPKSLNMKDVNLADPAQRQRFDQALAARAPKVVKLANWADPGDIARIEQENQTRAFSGLQPYTQGEQVFLPVLPHEIWAGCYGKVAGRAYWSANSKPQTVLLGLEMILLTRQGERIVGESSPDSVFGGFAPAASLAPQPPQQAPQPNYYQPPMPPQNGGGLSGLI